MEVIEETCKVCSYKESIILNKNIVCKRCNSIQGKVKSNSNKIVNKKIHLNNVLCKIGNINNDLLLKCYKELLEEIESNNLDQNLINMCYISGFLKSRNIKCYPYRIHLFNLYNERVFHFTPENQNDITKVFDAFIEYTTSVLKINSDNNLSYSIIIDLISRSLNFNLCTEPVVSKNSNETIYRRFDRFIKYISEKYNNDEMKNEGQCIPNFENIQQNIYNSNLIKFNL